MRSRPGIALAELITALMLTGIVAGALFAMIRTQTRLVSNTIERTGQADALRVASLVISGETRALAPADIRAVGADSLAVRIFRGTGIVCASDSGVAHVRYRGLRQPDTDKDSVLIADTEEVRPLDGVTGSASSCASAGELDITVHTPGERLLPGTVLLVFESGAYYFSTRALRFRRGGEGRQPITDERLDDATTGFLMAGDVFRAHVALRVPSRQAADLETASVVFPALNR